MFQHSAQTEHDRYAKSLLRMRRDKDRFFSSNPRSPLDPERRGPLCYYDPDLRYLVIATLTRFDDPQPVLLATSAGKPRPMLRYGRLDMSIEGEDVSLIAFRSAAKPDSPALFVPFRDATSGNESYGAGRYLEVNELPQADQSVDFNLAYNPFCAYSERFVCPLPPPDNWLSVAIRAGERAFVG